MLEARESTLQRDKYAGHERWVRFPRQFGTYAPPPAAVIDLLSRQKAGILALLREGKDGWSGEDWRAFFDERESIAEFSGGVNA